ncbi:unnamed protein product, partial [Mesorhabditis spiculigera]
MRDDPQTYYQLEKKQPSGGSEHLCAGFVIDGRLRYANEIQRGGATPENDCFAFDFGHWLGRLAVAPETILY